MEVDYTGKEAQYCNKSWLQMSAGWTWTVQKMLEGYLMITFRTIVIFSSSNFCKKVLSFYATGTGIEEIEFVFKKLYSTTGVGHTFSKIANMSRTNEGSKRLVGQH